jgi:drug/metabolite transporter (DMT)-like permease
VPTPSDTRSGFALALLAALAFGVLPILGKRAFAEGLAVAPLLAWRFSIGSALLWAVALARPGGVAAIPRRRRWALAALGALYAVNAALYFLALERIPAAMTSLVFYAYPGLVALLGAVFLRQRFGPPALVAMILALAGVALTVGFSRRALDPIGVALALLSAAVIACYMVLGELAVAGLPTLPSTVFVLTGATGAYWLWQALSGSPNLPPTSRGWLLVLLMGTVSTALSFLAMVGAVRRIGAGPTSILLTLEPAITVGLAAWLLGEGLAPRQLAGAALILGGVALLRASASGRAGATAHA